MQKFIEQIARRAGKFLLSRFQKDGNLRELRGTPKDVVTKYDKIADTMLVSAIEKKYPNSYFLTEERGYYGNPESDYLWIIDSLDGTGNFATGNPIFSVCIALVFKKRLQLGVIYAPVTDELFAAGKGRGAFWNGKRIRVSAESSLSRAYIVSCEGTNRDRAYTGRLFTRLYPNVLDIRKLGSAGLECAWVACGRAEAYVTTQEEVHDVAAGVLLVQEAGGKATDFDGRNWKVRRSDLVCSNGKLHEKILSLIKKV